MTAATGSDGAEASIDGVAAAAIDGGGAKGQGSNLEAMVLPRVAARRPRC